MNRKDAHTQMMYDLEMLQGELRDNWLEQSLPDEWEGMDYQYPSAKPTTRVTIRLDADMVRWFRKTFAHGYGQRINLILRIYWAGLLAGHLKAHPHDDNVPRIISSAQRSIDAREAERKRPAD